MVPPAPYRLPMTHKRFLLFAGTKFYPSGGWADLAGSFDTLERAVATGDHVDDLDIRDHDWFQVVDQETGEIVASHDAYTGERAGITV